jgi:hypothetical protein
VLVGDRAQDVAGAAVHGLPCVGAGWGPAEDGELAAAGAAVVARTPADVPAALARLPVENEPVVNEPVGRRRRRPGARGTSALPTAPVPRAAGRRPVTVWPDSG